MSRIFSSRKRALLGIVAGVIVATAAFAYWTAGGGGSGQGDIADEATGEIEITGVIDDSDDFRPGTTKTITLTATNTDPATDLHVTSTQIDDIALVRITGEGEDAVETAEDGCLEAWFTGWEGDVLQGQTVPHDDPDTTPADESVAVLEGPHSIEFLNSAADQDSCKGATVKFTVKSV